MITGAMVIDLKKTLDLVDHECLLFKLEHYGGISVDISCWKIYQPRYRLRVGQQINPTTSTSIKTSLKNRLCILVSFFAIIPICHVSSKKGILFGAEDR